MKPADGDYIEEFSKKHPGISKDEIAKLVESVEKSKEKTSFIQGLSSPAVIIGSIIGYAVGSQLPEDALSQIVGSISGISSISLIGA